MDDFKREIWMQVRAEVDNRETAFICNVLKSWMWANGVLNRSESEAEEDIILAEFFPEFVKLEDGRLWYRDSWFDKSAPDVPWFTAGWREPRLALIDYILTSTT